MTHVCQQCFKDSDTAFNMTLGRAKATAIIKNMVTILQVSGLRPQHDCLSALIDVTEEIRCQIDKRHTLSYLDHY